jgi:hypothetical protein
MKEYGGVDVQIHREMFIVCTYVVYLMDSYGIYELLPVLCNDDRISSGGKSPSLQHFSIQVIRN